MHINIKDLVPNTMASSCYILLSHSLKQARNGNTYMATVLGDKTGQLHANFWNATPEIADVLEDGEFVEATMSISLYNGAVSATIQHIMPASLTDEEKAELIPSVDHKSAVQQEFMAFVNQIGGQYRAVVDAALQENPNFTAMPAAKSMHHAEIGGLMLHTLEMLKIEKGIVEAFKGYQKIDTDLLYSATVLHDIGKIRELSLSPVGLVSDYSVEGNLLGHITIGVIYADHLADRCGLDHEKKILLEHMILSHHGEAQYGSPKQPMIVEAMILHEADCISARMHEFHDALESIEPGTMSDKAKGIGVPVYKEINAGNQIEGKQG